MTEAWGQCRGKYPVRLGNAGEWIRTTDLLITNQLLYRLSYTGLFVIARPVCYRPACLAADLPPVSDAMANPLGSENTTSSLWALTSSIRSPPQACNFAITP